MKRTGPLDWRIAIGAAYGLLLALLLIFLNWPWNVAVASVVLFKGLVFLAVSFKAGRIGNGRRRTVGAAQTGATQPPVGASIPPGRGPGPG